MTELGGRSSHSVARRVNGSHSVESEAQLRVFVFPPASVAHGRLTEIVRLDANSKFRGRTAPELGRIMAKEWAGFEVCFWPVVNRRDSYFPTLESNQPPQPFTFTNNGHMHSPGLSKQATWTNRNESLRVMLLRHRSGNQVSRLTLSPWTVQCKRFLAPAHRHTLDRSIRTRPV